MAAIPREQLLKQLMAAVNKLRDEVPPDVFNQAMRAWAGSIQEYNGFPPQDKEDAPTNPTGVNK